MSRKGFLILAAAILVLGAVARAGEGYQVVNGPKDFYFGHISLTDVRNDGQDPTVQRDGAKTAEPAVLNMPLGPGDIIRTSKERRVEIQFDNATIVRLDYDSELKIETILAQGLSSANQMSNLVLAKGRLFVMYKQYNSRELFQVLTPKAAVKFKHNSVGLVELTPEPATDVQVQYGKATALYGADLKTPKSLEIKAKERATFTPDNRFALGEPRPVGDFEMWNKSVNDRFEALHEGKSELPKPVQKLMPAVFDWAQRFGSRYGEWVFDKYFGYVWRPFYNDVYPWGSWRPYYVGRWTYYNNSMFWVPTEPWGWIPYHLGVWQWSSKRGWYWIPGSAFAPAWVDWAFYAGSWSWRPWSIWDWTFYDGWSWYGSMYGRMSLFDQADPSLPWMGYGYWGWRYNWLNPNQETPFGFKKGGAIDVNAVRDKDAFKEVNPRDPKKVRVGKPAEAPFPLPSSYRSGLKALMADLEKGDPEARESFQAQGKFASVVDREGLLAADVREKAVPFEVFRSAAVFLPANDPKRISTVLPPAVMTWTRYFSSKALQPGEPEVPAGGGSRVVVAPPEASPHALSPATSREASGRAPKAVLRTIDWNPDVRMAQRMGVEIRYLSGRNEIVCPELNLTSANSRFNPANRGAAGTSMDTYAGGGSSSGGGTSSGATSTGPSNGTASSGSATSTGTTSTGSTGTTTGHVIK